MDKSEKLRQGLIDYVENKIKQAENNKSATNSYLFDGYILAYEQILEVIKTYRV